MPHGIRDQYSDAPSWVVEASTGKTGKEQFGNTIFGVSPVEAQVTNGMASPGWVSAKIGTGPLSSLTITAGGTDYANDEVITIEAHTGADATANVITDGNGAIVDYVITAVGGLFRASPNVSIATSNGANASISAVLTGRAGRIQYETIVATRNIATDATDFANTSTSDVANTTGTADDTLFPDA